MEQYIIVKVREPKLQWPPYVYRDENGQYQMPTSNLARVRKAIHGVSKSDFVNLADIVSHTPWMTQEETDTIARIFDTAMARAKRATPRK